MKKKQVFGWVCHAPERGMFQKIHPKYDDAVKESFRIAEKDNVTVNVYRLVLEGSAVLRKPRAEWAEG